MSAKMSGFDTILAAGLASGDYMLVLDVSDTGGTGGSATGTPKKILYSQIQTIFQPLDATLTALAALTIAANTLTIGTGADAFSQTSFAANTFPARASTGNLVAKTITDFGLSLVDDADATAARTTLGLGTSAIVNTGTSGTTIPLLDGANTWSAAQIVSSNAAAAFAVGPNGNTNPVLRIVGNIGSAATGISVTGNAAGSAVVITVLSSGTNEDVIITPKGSGRFQVDSTYQVGTRFRRVDGTTQYLDIIPSAGGGGESLITSWDELQLCSVGSGGSASTKPVTVYRRRLQLTSSDYVSVNYSAGIECGLADGVIKLLRTATVGGTVSSPAITPTQITGNVDNYSPTTGWFQRWSSDASREVSGMVAGIDGETRHIWNVGAQNIVLKHDVTSTAANRFFSSSGADITLTPNKCVLAMYDSTTARWRITLLP